MAYFLSLFGLSTKCTLFKCHKCIAKNIYLSIILYIKIFNLNKNIYWWVKFNKHTPMDYVLSSTLTFKCIVFIISSQYFFNRESMYDTRWKQNMDWKNLRTNNNGVLNDKVFILVFFVRLIFFLPLTCMSKNCLDGKLLGWTLLVD
jgi:hypothetical protein